VNSIQQFYNRVGKLYDWAEQFEGKAKVRAFERLMVGRGDRVLNVGAGTGIDQQKLARQVGSTGLVVAVDISSVMLKLVRQRTGQPVVQADARDLPFAPETFDGLFCSYVLDLIPLRDLGATLDEFRRVLRPGGLIALVTLTEGVTPLSRALVGIWKRLYAVSPIVCGGCRPIELLTLVDRSGFRDLSREVVVEAGFPSQVVVARR
jgi:ubiquinone/menaquinone biosynthesis C-methylase UbiE